MSTQVAPNSKKVDLVSATEELALLMTKYPESVEQELIAIGDQHLHFEENIEPNGNHDVIKFFSSFRELITLLVNELSNDGALLFSSKIGILAKEKRISTFVTPIDTAPSGNVLFSLVWKSESNSENQTVTQDDMNIALYRIAYCWAGLKKRLENLDKK